MRTVKVWFKIRCWYRGKFWYLEESRKLNIKTQYKETREVIGTEEGFCAMVGIGMGKGMSSGWHYYWMLVKEQGQDQMIEQVWILI